ncbi:MAG: PKD domain-containing protein, partial [Thermoplasmata archaeon]|nr:PKD domain-containing protein [Thermoplasmata archaeon]
RMDSTGTTDNDPEFPTNVTFLWMVPENGTMVGYLGTTFDHTFEAPGNYTCELVVTDPAGNSATLEFWALVVDEEAPKAVAGPDITTLPGDEVFITGGNSSDNHMIAEYLWMINGDPQVRVEGAELRYTFMFIGNYGVLLNVTDASGNEAFDELRVDVTVPSPITEIWSPGNGTEVTAKLTVTGFVTSEIQNVNVSYRLVGDADFVTKWWRMTVSGDFRFSIDLTDLDEGEYILEMRANDGYTLSKPETLMVKVVMGDEAGSGQPLWIIGIAVVIVVVLVVAIVAVIVMMRRRVITG